VVARGVMMRARRSAGAKRHIITDTSGHLVGAQVRAAEIQDRDGAPSFGAQSYPTAVEIATVLPQHWDRLRSAVAARDHSR
jgi:hypothetical protein